MIVPSFTFPATVSAIVRAGLTPVFCEVGESDGLLDLDNFEKLVTDRTCAVMPVNLFGNVCDAERIVSIADSKNLRVLYDSAQALGSRHNGQWCGRFGDAEVFSLHATKFINGFEGGFITTSNKELAEKLRRLRNFGFDENDDLVVLGTNAKLSEIHAAMALTNLEQIDSILAINHRNLQAYNEHLPPSLGLLPASLNVESNHQYIPVLASPTVKERLVQRLQAEGVVVISYFRLCHLLKLFHDPSVSCLY